MNFVTVVFLRGKKNNVILRDSFCDNAYSVKKGWRLIQSILRIQMT